MDKLWTCLIVLGLGFVQNIFFTICSRSRNRNKQAYHATAAILSNGVWFLTFRYLVRNNMDFMLFLPYCAGTTAGSLFGAKIAMWVEKLIHAEADGHLRSK